MVIRVPSAEELPWFDGILADHHYLGAGRPVGDYLRQVVDLDRKAVALLVWGPAFYALKDAICGFPGARPNGWSD